MKIYTAIGLMSGTSLDGIDVALLRTDGVSFAEALDFKSYEYDAELRRKVRQCFGLSSDPDGRVKEAEKLVTEAHIKAVQDFGHKADLVGFHGQTIFHDPANRKTWQIGDGQALADASGMQVVYDFRSADVAAGGQGAPFLPLYHRVRVKSAGLALPCVILNIGGVGNVTWIGAGEDDVLAFDTGPGNAMIDDWMLEKTGQAYDADGKMAATGQVDEALLRRLLSHPYFAAPVPKSLDRNDFITDIYAGLNTPDGAATLSAFTVDSIAQSFAHFPQKPLLVHVTGGGRKNGYLMQRLAQKLGIPVTSVDDLGWNGDAMEAEGFAYLAVRSLLGLPLSLPTTTGCPVPMTGGKHAYNI
ncbi:MAG: anhydro-N-acetylmuramic acid kinase [Alphaproteobacteria bacterium]|nr:anhydro-N-acetylmuramic acid kinase [Alphaproteobacteria bacterium]